MPGEAISLYASRLIGLILTASNLALEINPAGEVVFAIDGVCEDPSASKWVGKHWRTLIYAEDHRTVADVLKASSGPGRKGPYLVRRAALAGAVPQPALVSVVMLPHLAPNLSMTLSPAPIAPPYVEAETAPMLDASEFARRLPELVENNRQKGLGVELAMIELLGFEKASTADGGQGGLARDITDLLRARSISKVGSPCRRPRMIWKRKKSLMMERFLFYVRGAPEPQSASRNSSMRSVPAGGSKSSIWRSRKWRASLSRQDS